MNITLIHNPDAGGDNQLSGDDILELIHKAGHSATLQSSKDAGWDKALHGPADIVAVAGGDGIVGQVAKRMIGRQIPIAILPMGTANNVATTLGVKHLAVDELIFGWTSARRVKFDVGNAKGPWGSIPFIEGLGMGLFTDTMSRLDARDNIQLAHLSDTDEKLISVLQMLRSHVESCHSQEMKITFDDRDLSGKYILLEAMNIHYVGPNFHLAPPADPGDGLLDLVIASYDERERIHQYLSDRIDNKSNYPGLTIHKGKHLRIECAGLTVHIDDDLWPEIGAPSPPNAIVIEVSVVPEALEMLAPA
ncbi:MAG: diacylglycerol/lipid kinase family protein [Candidatus Binatia bacterium]